MTDAVCCVARTAEDMRALGARLAQRLEPGDAVLLDGPMGAGKSELARGAARGLGVRGAVPSPTFTILNVYDEGAIPIYHFDLYRVTDEDELYEIGFDEFVRGDGLALVEWPQHAGALEPRDALRARIEIRPDGSRAVTLTKQGEFDMRKLARFL